MTTRSPARRRAAPVGNPQEVDGTPIRVAVVDDQVMFREALVGVLTKYSDISLVGEGEDGYAALKLIERIAIDVLILSPSLPRLKGLEVVRSIRVRHKSRKFILLATVHSEELVSEAFRAGVSGYLTKNQRLAELVEAIREVHAGRIFISERALARPAVRGRNAELDTLTPREREVLQLVAQGYSSKQIANFLRISEHTVERHREHLMSKLGIHTIAGLTQFAIREKLVRFP